MRKYLKNKVTNEIVAVSEDDFKTMSKDRKAKVSEVKVVHLRAKSDGRTFFVEEAEYAKYGAPEKALYDKVGSPEDENAKVIDDAMKVGVIKEEDQKTLPLAEGDK